MMFDDFREFIASAPPILVAIIGLGSIVIGLADAAIWFVQYRRETQHNDSDYLPLLSRFLGEVFGYLLCFLGIFVAFLNDDTPLYLAMIVVALLLSIPTMSDSGRIWKMQNLRKSAEKRAERGIS